MCLLFFSERNMKCFFFFFLCVCVLFLSLKLHHLGDPSDCPRGLSNSFNLQSVWVSVSHKNGKELHTRPPPPPQKKKKKKKIATWELIYMNVLA